MATKTKKTVSDDDNSPTSDNGALPYQRSGSGVQSSAAGPSGKQKVGHTTLDANNEPQKFKKLELENLQLSIQHAILKIIGNHQLYQPERQLLMADLEKVFIININGSEVPRNASCSNSPYLARSSMAQDDAVSVSGSVRGASISNYRFKAYAPRAFDFFRKIYRVELDDFLKSMTDPMKCIPNPGASGSLFFITGDDCFIMKTLQKKEAVFLLQLYPGYILNLYQSPDTLLPKYFGCFCYQSALGKNVRLAIMNNLIPRNVTLWRKYDLKGSTYKRRTDASKSSSKVPTLKDLNFKEDFGEQGILLDEDIYTALINRLDNDTLMLESFEIMDYSFLMAIEEVDMEREREATLRPENDNVPSFYQYSEILNLPSLRHQKGIPAIRQKDGKHLRLYVGIIDILQKYIFKKKLEHHMKAVFLESHENEVSVTHPHKYQLRFMEFMRKEVFKMNPIEVPAGHPQPPSMYYSVGKSGRSLPNPRVSTSSQPKYSYSSYSHNSQQQSSTANSATLPTTDGATSSMNYLHPSHSREFGDHQRRSTAATTGPPTGGRRLSPVTSHADQHPHHSRPSSGSYTHVAPGTGSAHCSKQSTTTYQYSTAPPVAASDRVQRRPSSENASQRMRLSGNNITAANALGDRPGTDSGYRSSTTSTNDFSPSNKTERSGALPLAKQESLSMFNTELDEGYLEFSRSTAANSSSYSYSGRDRSNNRKTGGFRNPNNSSEPTTPVQNTSKSYATPSSKYSTGANWKPHKETPLNDLNSSRFSNGSTSSKLEAPLAEETNETRVAYATVVELEDDD